MKCERERECEREIIPSDSVHLYCNTRLWSHFPGLRNDWILLLPVVYKKNLRLSEGGLSGKLGIHGETLYCALPTIVIPVFVLKKIEWIE